MPFIKLAFPKIGNGCLDFHHFYCLKIGILSFLILIGDKIVQMNF